MVKGAVPDAARPPRPIPPALRAALVIALLYLFLVGVSLLEAGIKAMGKSFTDDLFSHVDNPVAGLFVGVLATVLVQSSSASTATIVALVGAGTVGVDDAVPMIMGANIGTTVTNTLVSLGHLRQSSDFQRAFAAATVHDFFNVLAVLVLLPLEVTTHALSNTAEWLSERFLGSSGSEWESPVKKWVKEPVSWIEDLLDGVGASGKVLGVLLLLVGLAFIFVALASITRNMKVLIADRVERSINTILGKAGGLVGMLLGLIITIAVQSSSITTSILIPLAGSGVLALRAAYPVTLGANVGTTITAVLASLATNRPEALTVALAHTTFNVMGIMLFYPVPALRDIPVRLAEWMAAQAVVHRSYVLAYVIGLFVVVPLVGVLILG